MTEERPLGAANAESADPGPGRRTNSIGHPVERMLNASARDILAALENGFRARADLKGKLAELFAARYLDGLQLRGVIDRYATSAARRGWTGVGSRFRIVEAFGRRPDFFVFDRFIRPRLFFDAMGRAWLRCSTPNHPSRGGG